MVGPDFHLKTTPFLEPLFSFYHLILSLPYFNPRTKQLGAHTQNMAKDCNFIPENMHFVTHRYQQKYSPNYAYAYHTSKTQKDYNPTL